MVQVTAVGVFNTCVKQEGVEFEYVKSCIERDATGQCFISVLDKFDMYLALKEEKKGKRLLRTLPFSITGNDKMWLFGLFPEQHRIVEAKLLSMRKALENYCMKRDGKVVNKAQPCTKNELKNMMLYLYSNACTSSNYQDSVLLCLLWYLFGCASDLSLIRKLNLSVGAADALFVRLIRMKTSDEQGLSLFPDIDATTCPLLAMAAQPSSCTDLLDNLPELPTQAVIDLSPLTLLLELLGHPEDFKALDTPTVTGKDSTPTIYSHVSRILDRVTTVAGVQVSLSFHSFHHGSAQHANGYAHLTTRWGFDRGSCNISTTKKRFNYIFNTGREDHKVSKALSGYETSDNVEKLDLTLFDTQTQETIASIQRLLFTTWYKLEHPQYNVSQFLITYLIHHFP